MIPLQELADELLNDPAGLGYAELLAADDHVEIARRLNAERGSVSITRAEIPSREIREAVVSAEWAGVSAALRDLLTFHTQGETINPNDPNTRQAFLDAFPAGSTTRSNLGALLTRSGSRAEDLWGAGETVSHQMVAEAVELL